MRGFNTFREVSRGFRMFQGVIESLVEFKESQRGFNKEFIRRFKAFW